VLAVIFPENVSVRPTVKGKCQDTKEIIVNEVTRQEVSETMVSV